MLRFPPSEGMVADFQYHFLKSVRFTRPSPMVQASQAVRELTMSIVRKNVFLIANRLMKEMVSSRRFPAGMDKSVRSRYRSPAEISLHRAPRRSRVNIVSSDICSEAEFGSKLCRLRIT